MFRLGQSWCCQQDELNRNGQLASDVMLLKKLHHQPICFHLTHKVLDTERRTAIAAIVWYSNRFQHGRESAVKHTWPLQRRLLLRQQLRA